MNRRQLNSVALAPLLSLLAVLFTIPALAQNRAFVSTSLEGSQASYLLEFSAATGGTVDKFRLTFPAGTLGGGVALVNLLIGNKPAKTPIVTSIDPLDPNALLLDVPKTTKIKAGVQIILELLGLTNPIAGDYQIAIELIGKTGSVLETLTPIPLSIAAVLVAPPRFVDNGDGTISDNQTGLMWEKKLASNDTGGNCANGTQANRSIHCVNNTYTWSAVLPNPDGTLFTDFLARINKALSTSADGSTVADVCFAGHCDWRAPNIAELRTILLAQFPCSTSPCIDPIFGPTQASFYWSSTTDASSSSLAWDVGFSFGFVVIDGKNGFNFARAVRGGR